MTDRRFTPPTTFPAEYVTSDGLPNEAEYIRADLVRAQIEAAVKRALEGAAQEAYDWFYDPEEDMVTDVRLGKAIRALDPAQFIGGDKP
jgi:hypothetical protein